MDSGRGEGRRKDPERKTRCGLLLNVHLERGELYVSCSRASRDGTSVGARFICVQCRG